MIDSETQARYLAAGIGRDSDTVVGERLGVSRQSVHQMRERLGIKSSTEHRWRRLAVLLRGLCSRRPPLRNSDIAEFMGVSTGTIYGMRKRWKIRKVAIVPNPRYTDAQILRALDHAKGCRAVAAERLGMHVTHLANRLARMRKAGFKIPFGRSGGAGHRERVLGGRR